MEKRKRSLRMNSKAKKGELIISLQGKGDKDSILEKARQLCIEEGNPITEKVLSDRVQKVHKEWLLRLEKIATERIEQIDKQKNAEIEDLK